MFKYFGFFLLMLVSFWYLFVIPYPVSADFDESSLRLDRVKTSSATGGLVCASTQTVNTEGRVQISFPIEFNLNTLAANWTVQTSHLPGGAIAWPGIGTASSVSGNVVTFPSADLNSNTLYCFHFSETNTLTTPSSAGTYQLQIRTQTGASSVIDMANNVQSIVHDDQISVSAHVNLQSTDLQHQFTVDNGADVINQNTELTFEITYGINHPMGETIYVEADWSRGILDGESSPTQDIWEYVVGSATAGYNNAPAVVNLQNRKITWELTNFPGNTTDQTVQFKLRTVDNYKGLKPVHLAVSSRLYTESTTTDYYSIGKRYLYLPQPDSSVPTPVPSASSAPPAPVPLQISKVDFSMISSTAAQVDISLNRPARVSLLYGTNLKNLSTRVRVIELKEKQRILLEGLDPGTAYYLRIEAVDASGKLARSDIFYFKTATKELEKKLAVNNLVITSLRNILLTDGVVDLAGSNSLLLSLIAGTDIEFNFQIPEVVINQIVVYLRSRSDVLGIMDDVYASEAVTHSASLTEISDKGFYGRIAVPTDLGLYDLVARIQDSNGNLVETPLFGIKPVLPITIYGGEDKNVVEGARVYFYIFDERQRIYHQLSSQILHLANPAITDSNGQVIVNLPEGKYRIEVSTIGFKDKTIDFSVGSEEEYPQIYLESDPETFVNFFRYYARTFIDFIDLTRSLSSAYLRSNRWFDFLMLSTLTVLLISTWFSFLLRFNTSIVHLPKIFKLFWQQYILKKQQLFKLNGLIVSEKKREDSMLVLKSNHDVVIDEKKLKADGSFSFDNLKPGAYILEIITEKYTEKQVSVAIYEDKVLEIKLEQNTEQTLLSKFRYIVREGFGLCFEFLIMLSLLFEIFFIYTFGWQKVLPFLLVSIINLVVFLQFIRRR